MKTTFSLLAMLILGFGSQAQTMKPDRETRSAEIKKIQAMEMAFITKELNLSLMRPRNSGLYSTSTGMN